MATTAYAHPAAFLGTLPTRTPTTRPTTTPAAWAPAAPRSFERSRWGDVVLVTFLLAQCFDGVFTYIGVMTYGLGIEANPLIAALMGTFGHGTALTIAKTLAAALGICLHLRQIHSAVAVLSAFYISVAIVPWMVILFG